MKEFADWTRDGRLVSVLAGGYNMATVGVASTRSASLHLAASPPSHLSVTNGSSNTAG